MIRLLRLTAYRQFTYWVHRNLGKGVRRVIPACAVIVIRKKFPEDSGEYTASKQVSMTITGQAGVARLKSEKCL